MEKTRKMLKKLAKELGVKGDRNFYTKLMSCKSYNEGHRLIMSAFDSLYMNH